MALNPLPPYHHGTTRLHQHQINLRDLFSIKSILASRGYKVRSEGNLGDLLISPLPRGPEYELLLRNYNDNDCRRQIQDYVYRRIERPNLEDVTTLINLPGFNRNTDAFTKTFEWYFGEAMVRYFEGFSFSYGVDVENVRVNETHPGDYDTLVVMRNLGLYYFECKTGEITKHSIKKTVQRSLALNCDSAIIVAFELSEWDLSQKIAALDHPLYDPPAKVALHKIQIRGNQEGCVYEWHNCYFILATKDFVEQMKTVIRVSEAKRNYYHNRFRPLHDRSLFSKMGIEIQSVKSNSH